MGRLNVETKNPIARKSFCEIGMYYQLADFCTGQNRGFAGSNALIALQ